MLKISYFNKKNRCDPPFSSPNTDAATETWGIYRKKVTPTSFGPRHEIDAFTIAHDGDFLFTDFDGDNIDDVFISSSDWELGSFLFFTSDHLSWSGFKGFTWPREIALSHFLGTCDCNKDGVVDFIARAEPSSGYAGYFFVFRGSLDPAEETFRFIEEIEINDYTNIFPMGDFNGDGILDFLGSELMNYSKLNVYLGSDSCHYSLEESYNTSHGVMDLHVGNFNGDIYDDITYSPFSEICIWKNFVVYGSEEGLDFDNIVYYLSDNLYAYTMVADVNSDGLDDIGLVDIGYYMESGNDTLAVHFRLCSGDGFEAGCDTLILPSKRISRFLSCDLNDDGRDDLCYFPARDTLAILLNAGEVATFLQSFRARYREAEGVVLEWEVTEGSSCELFRVYRSMDGKMFKLVGETDAIQGKNDYSFIDLDVPSGISIYKLEAVEKDGGAKVLATDEVTVPEMPVTLRQNYPNPFNPGTRIEFNLPEAGRVSLEIYDVSGRLVRRLIEGKVLGPGRVEELWDGTNDSGDRVSSGVYYYILKAGKDSLTRKMVLIK